MFQALETKTIIMESHIRELLDCRSSCQYCKIVFSKTFSYIMIEYDTFSAEDFQVFVSDFNGKTLTVDVNNKMTIDALKSEVSTKKGIISIIIIITFIVLLKISFFDTEFEVHEGLNCSCNFQTSYSMLKYQIPST